MDCKKLGEKIVPYRGLKPFESEHTELFFGRERIIKDICEKLDQNNPLLIIGSSGSGKSSIIRAGLIPLLEKNTWDVLPLIRPGNSLLSKLIETFEKFFVEENGLKQLRRFIHGDPKGLRQLENYLPGTNNYLLIIDQFEEVFTLAPQNECQHFIKLLAQFLMQPSARLKLLLAMRADFLEFCLQYSALTHLIQTQTIYIPPLEESEWRQIIVGPAEYVNYFIEAGLQEEILKDIDQKANCLPLLQLTLLKLWENSDRSKRFITHAAYLEVGGLFGALNYYTDLFFENLSDVEQILLKKIFLKLVRIGIAKDTRQRQLKERLLELAGDNQDEQDCVVSLLQKLLDEQLLIQEEEEGNVWIDLAHEVLIENWQLLMNWQQETRRQRQLIAPLEDALFSWQKNPNNKNLATPEVLKKIMNDQKNLEYLDSLDTSLQFFYQKSVEYHRPQQSSQLVNTQRQRSIEQSRQNFIPDTIKINSSSNNASQIKEDELLETLEQKETLDFQKAKDIVKHPQKNSAIINNIVNVYGDYISSGNQTNYECTTIGSDVKRMPKLQQANPNQVHQPTKREQKLEIKKDGLIDFAIITAIKTERLAILNAFEIDETMDRIRKGSHTYWYKRLNLKDGKFYEIIVAQSLDMANVNAAILTNDALHHWQPATVLMVGIAAAAKSEQHLGNLVIGKEVYYYETGRVTAEGKLPEPKSVPVDATLLDRVQALPESDFSILVERPDGTNTRPKVEPGVIASGDKVIADATERDAIASANRKIMAIEMEGYGVISAAWQSFDQVRCLVIRSLCDYANSNKNDQWHTYAAAVAAGFTKHFLIDEPLAPKNPPEKINH